ncbi:hypothetical protein [Arthrobacter yangruifuii]|uniref:hypothetical protein n=1 Tax=Arthrobacter yangruifuii TaxID=2606616 RepID=UPI0011B3EEF5|nr:hypothetical protein [Arthrobacter yangruifuii]
MINSSLPSAAPPRRSLPDRWRTETYLLRFDLHLEGVAPGRERRAIVREVRQALAGDPRDAETALDDLGSPASLARQYAEDAARRPLWSMGAVTAGAALLVYWMVFLSFTFGMLAAVESTDQSEAHGRLFFVDVLAFSGPDGVGIGWTSEWAWLVVPAAVVLAAFLLGARVWRVAQTRP